MQNQSYTITKIRRTILASAVGLTFLSGTAALADCTNKACVDWKKLNLSTQQSEQIQTLEQDWNQKYLRIQPQIISTQKKLQQLLQDPKADPLEIMATQQSVIRFQEQLRQEATSNYLKKKALLNTTQQQQLEGMLAQMVAQKQNRTTGITQPQEPPGFMGDLLQKVRWAIDQH